MHNIECVRKHTKVKKMSNRGKGRGVYPGNGPFRNLPPWERPGGVSDSANTGTCTKYPWLSRGWWAYPSLPVNAPTINVKLLEQYVKATENQLTILKTRLAELEKTKVREVVES